LSCLQEEKVSAAGTIKRSASVHLGVGTGTGGREEARNFQREVKKVIEQHGSALLRVKKKRKNRNRNVRGKISKNGSENGGKTAT